MKLSTAAALTGLLLSVAGSALAKPASPAGLSALDKDYLKDAAQSNLEEIKARPAMEQHASTSAVKAYARRMAQEHGHANRDLQALALRTGYSLPKDMSEDQKAIITRLTKLQGGRFDAAYRQEMIRDHTGDIAEAQREISLGRNPMVKANAVKTLSLLKMHLKMARALPSR